jgi:hypothetical protein
MLKSTQKPHLLLPPVIQGLVRHPWHAEAYHRFGPKSKVWKNAGLWPMKNGTKNGKIALKCIFIFMVCTILMKNVHVLYKEW